ncbi:hypothetical protein TWF225_006946 [Orbilia oligospora]|nr:hypothetical protein TWF225_006946 [Orbilia oligospora]KAF3246177.1 hypothetical protein TWF128_008990 [Orbilia oligospora]KAF3264151.1 hypothetical protein TWF217_003306 [Orbilia oligospora]
MIFIPREIQYLILDEAEKSQYTTLILVCKAWKTKLFNKFKQRYVQPHYPDAEYIATHQELDLGLIAPVPPEKAPFLIHSAIVGHSRYLRGTIKKIDWGTGSWLQLGEYNVDKAPKPDDPDILADTEKFKKYLHDPVIIPNAEDTMLSGRRINLVTRYPGGSSHQLARRSESNTAKGNQRVLVGEALGFEFFRGGRLLERPELEEDEVVPKCSYHIVYNCAPDPNGKAVVDSHTDVTVFLYYPDIESTVES